MRAETVDTARASVDQLTAQAQMGAAWRIGIDHRATPLVTHGLRGLLKVKMVPNKRSVLAGGTFRYRITLRTIGPVAVDPSPKFHVPAVHP